MNRYEWKNGSLYHFINDELRAIVAPEHVADYRLRYPDAPESETAHG